MSRLLMKMKFGYKVALNKFALRQFQVAFSKDRHFALYVMSRAEYFQKISHPGRIFKTRFSDM